MTENEPRVLAEEIRLRYAAIVESSDDAIIAKTLDGVISAWNAAAERMFGYTEHEAIGQPITMIIPAALFDEEHDILRRLRAGERVDHYETVRVTKAGARIDVSLTISPLRDRAGMIIGCSKIARDITKAKQAEAALRQSEQRLAREVAGAKTLQSISTRLISESTPESLYAQILGAAMELMASDFASVQTLAADQASLKLLAWKNFHLDSAAFWERVDVEGGARAAKRSVTKGALLWPISRRANSWRARRISAVNIVGPLMESARQRAIDFAGRRPPSAAIAGW